MVTSVTSFAKDISKSALQWSRHLVGVCILFLAMCVQYMLRDRAYRRWAMNGRSTATFSHKCLALRYPRPSAWLLMVFMAILMQPVYVAKDKLYRTLEALGAKSNILLVLARQKSKCCPLSLSLVF